MPQSRTSWDRRIAPASVKAKPSRDEFLSSVSHDLKTPLTALLLVAQMTKRRLDHLALPGLAPLIEQQGMAEQAIERMTGMVNELLDITRLQFGQPLPVDLHPT